MTDRPEERVFLALGSNIDPEDNLVRAVTSLARRLQVRGASRVFETPPVGAPGAPRFLNAALEVRWSGSARELKFEVLRPVERELGRVRSRDRNAPRTLDLDISLFGDRVISDPEVGLEVPDPEILTAAHVALPLADLAPELPHPVTGASMAEIAAGFGEIPGVVMRPDVELWPQQRDTAGP